MAAGPRTVRTRLCRNPLEELDEETLGRHELRGGSRTAGLPDGRDSRRPSEALRTDTRHLSGDGGNLRVKAGDSSEGHG